MPQFGPQPGQADTIARLFVADRPAPDADAWPAIDGSLLGEEGVAVPPFPLDSLPPSWREWVADTARSVNVPSDYVAQAVLAAVAGVCGAGIWVSVSAVWSDPVSLWLAVVGAPSSGKSPALASVRRLLRLLENEGAAPATRDERDPPPRIFAGGSLDAVLDTLHDSQRGALLWRDEPEGCFAPLPAGGEVRELDRWPVTILGALEPDRRASLVHRGRATVAARFLYAWPAPPSFQPLAERTPARDDEALARLRALRGKAGTVRHPLCLCVDGDGLAALDRFLGDLHAELRHADGLLAAWLGKGRGVVPRLAAILHLLDWSVAQFSQPSAELGDLGPDAIERAIALWSGYYRPHATAFFERTATSGLEAQARRVVRWLKSCGLDEISREDVRRTALGQTVDASGADRVLARLTDAGVLRPVAGEPGPKGGRPALRWQANPALRLS